MKVGIMQPYLFPYIGYFQLINAVDVFVVHDDVQYIQAGWINRNRILFNGKEFLFTLGVKKDQYTKKINERYFSDNFLKEKKKLSGTLQTAYSKAPHFKDVFQVIEKVLANKEENISKNITEGLKTICEYLGISTRFQISSELNKDNGLAGEERVIEICKKLNATQYINPIGGLELYHKPHFLTEKMELNFLKSGEIIYPQFQNEFVPWLSIVDVMMFNSKEEIRKMLSVYELL